MSAPDAIAYEVVANNLSRTSENKIHDDATARRFGFAGALVPGVEVYAYATRAAVRRWGRAWLERGAAECRFLKPVYDGRPVKVTATPAGAGLALRVESDGALCAEGAAALHADAAPPAAAFDAPPPPEVRPPADETSLAVDVRLATRPLPLTRKSLDEYLRGVGETEPIYAAEGLAHPGLALRQCNQLLMQNVVLGPWIHVASRVANHGLARVGEALTARGRVVANYERKGHRFVELEALVLADGERPVAQVRHTAIYRPRQVGG